MNNIIITASIIIILILFILILKLWAKFRKKVYKLFIRAEKRISNGDDKMNEVISQIQCYLPWYLNIFLTEDVLRWLIQKMFNTVEDFLNDGIINNNYKKESEE